MCVCVYVDKYTYTHNTDTHINSILYIIYFIYIEECILFDILIIILHIKKYYNNCDLNVKSNN